MKDPYELLGVSKTASDDEIKRAYRKLAQKHHPDTNKGDKASEEKFKEINGAYEILSDKQKRAQFDQFGAAGGMPGGGGGANGFDFQGFGDGFADIFESFFGGGSQSSSRRVSMDGSDREAMVRISFTEAAFGTEKAVKLTRVGECETCAGRGAAPGAKISTCSQCKGTGEVRVVKNTILGQVSTRRVCDTCGGAGRVPDEKCKACKGAGKERRTEDLTIKIPAGIPDESTMRIVGKGDAGSPGGAAGDLYIHIQVAPHETYTRRANDVYSQQTIHLLQAVLGDVIPVETIHGTIQVKVPAGTQHGKVIRIKNYGIPRMKSEGRGDHYLEVVVRVPDKLSKKERELYKQLTAEAGLKIKEEPGFLEGMFT